MMMLITRGENRGKGSEQWAQFTARCVQTLLRQPLTARQLDFAFLFYDLD